MGDNEDTELYKHEGGKRKKISCREERVIPETMED